jgi:hypothetical protein
MKRKLTEEVPVVFLPLGGRKLAAAIAADGNNE